MSLTAAEVAEIMRLVEQSKFDELRLDMDGIKLTLRRTGASGCIVRHLTTPPATEDRAATDAPLAAPTGTSDALDPGCSEITAPLLGIFYRAPKPGSAPFVEIGSVVDDETVIGIIEVMKLMNTVRAGVSGTITEILPANEALVCAHKCPAFLYKTGIDLTGARPLSHA